MVSNVAGNVTSNPATLTVNSTSTMPQFGHVFIVIGENSAYSTTYNSSNMPYLTYLANQYGLATKYWADTHPSIGNYEVMTAGQIFTNDDSLKPSSLTLSSDNIALEVEKAGKTWIRRELEWPRCREHRELDCAPRPAAVPYKHQ